jgi:hypothetical protein
MKEDFDQVPSGVKALIIAAAAPPRGIGWYDCFHCSRLDCGNDPIGVVSGISDTNTADRVFEQCLGLRGFMPMSWGQGDEERLASRIDDGMKFGREATSTVPQCIDRWPPFAPHASWCARAIEASMSVALSSTCTRNALNNRSHAPFFDQSANRL